MVFSQKTKLVATLVLVVCVSATVSKDARATEAAWHKTSFDGKNVTLVHANPSRPEQIAAVVNGQLNVSWDGGLLWRSTNLPDFPNVIRFDPVYFGTVYAATNRGIYRSQDIGITWQKVGSAASGVLVTIGLDVGKDYVFATQYNGAGTATKLLRLTRDGSSTELASPAVNPGPISIDDETIYVGTATTMFRSSDNGGTWQAVAGPPQIGFRTLRIVAKEGQIWQLSFDGLFYSGNSGATWSRHTSRDNLVEHYYSDIKLNGLSVNRGRALFGVSSWTAKKQDVVLNTSGSVTKLALNQIAQDVASGGGVLWAATANGLWSNREVVGSEAEVKRPVIIIPGILGSWQVKGQWVIDPITKAYGPLLTRLVVAGFVPERTLFTFPYQWRQDNTISARELDSKISETKVICGCPKVDLVGHSMGGLVARAYVQSDYYDGDVENLIQLGTPNGGSVYSYSIWEGGTLISKTLWEWVTGKLFNIEAQEEGYNTIAEYVRSEVTSVEQLLPTYSYIEGRVYPVGYPRNWFLERLNTTESITKLKGRAKFKVFGTDNQPTLTGLKVSNADSLRSTWPSGEILQKIYGPGDGTVPSNSLRQVGAASMVLNSSHGGLPTHAAQNVAQSLLGGAIDIMSLGEATKKYMMVYVKSPVRLSVTDPIGRVVNDGRSDVPEAFYTGSDEKVQFMAIPNPVEGQYKITLLGKGEGAYTVGVSTFSEDAPEADNTVEYVAQTKPNQKDELDYTTSSNEISFIGSSGGGDADTGDDTNDTNTNIDTTNDQTQKGSGNQAIATDDYHSLLASYLSFVQNLVPQEVVMGQADSVFAGEDAKVPLLSQDDVGKAHEVKWATIIIFAMIGASLWLTKRKE